HYLLPRGTRHAGKNTSLSGRGVSLVFQHAAHWDVLTTKIFEQEPPRFIVSKHAHGQDVHAQIGEIINRVGAATRHHRPLPVLENQYRSFSWDPGSFSEHE